ncbi:MAG: MFS transporter [Lachnospiraceae bacterium]|nr:MFS transporter [Lachnospiraceae bacterium]
MKTIFRKLLFAFTLILLSLCLYLGRGYMRFRRAHDFTTVSAAFYGENSRIFVVDQGKTSIKILDQNDMLTDDISGEDEERFYYADCVTEDGKGRVFLADRIYGKNEVSKERGAVISRVLEFDDGKQRVVQELVDSQVYELQYYEGYVYILQKEDFGLGLYRFEPGGEVEPVRRYYIGDVLNDASVDLTTGVAAITVRRGTVRIMKKGSNMWETVEKKAEHSMPNGISARSGTVFFSDLYSGEILSFPEESPANLTCLYKEEDLLVDSVEASKDGVSVLACNSVGFFRIGNGRIEYINSAKYEGFFFTALWWLGFIILSLCFLWIFRGVPGRALQIFQKESAKRVAIVVMAVISVSSFVVFTLMSTFYQKEDEELVNGLKLFAGMLSGEMDPEDLLEMQSEEDYGSSAYMSLRTGMDILTERATEVGFHYFYTLYREDGGKLRYILNYEDDVSCGEPAVFSGDGDYVRDVFQSGKSYAIRSRDSDGLWLSVYVPIYLTNGEVGAVLEAGMDFGYQEREREAATFDTILNVICTSAVMMMLILEAVFLMSFLELKQKGEDRDVTQKVPLRTLMFLAYMTSSMQDTFIAVLTSRLYQGQLPIPDGVAYGLPLSAQLLMMAVFSAMGGRFTERYGSRKTIIFGVLSQVVGFLCCGILNSYTGLVLGNLMVGAGMGLIYVSCNTIAAMGGDINAVGKAFAAVSAGALSGLTIGAGLASVFFSIGGHRLVYFVGAAILLTAFPITLFSANVKTASDKEVILRQEISFFRFFLNRRVMGFFLLILIPFMMALSYREYFFPLYMQEYGFGEVRVGQVYLLCGLLVLYLGPRISAQLLKWIGAFWSVVLSSALMGLNMLIFVLYPNEASVLLGVVILSVIISFAYTCQYTFYEQLPDCVMYGDGKSMGVYSVMESIGQTLGPMVYGAALTMGYRQGIWIFGGSMLMLVLLFVLMMNRQAKFYQ